MKKAKLNYKIYNQAAEDEDMKSYWIGCCWAITKGSDPKGDKYGAYKDNLYVKAFEKVFKPKSTNLYYFGSTDEENLLHRQLALDLMAEIVKSGDL